MFRRFECFLHPNLYVQCGKRPLPQLLEVYPDAKDQIVSFGIKNLATLTIESVHGGCYITQGSAHPCGSSIPYHGCRGSTLTMDIRFFYRECSRRHHYYSCAKTGNHLGE